MQKNVMDDARREKEGCDKEYSDLLRGLAPRVLQDRLLALEKRVAEQETRLVQLGVTLSTGRQRGKLPACDWCKRGPGTVQLTKGWPPVDAGLVCEMCLHELQKGGPT